MYFLIQAASSSLTNHATEIGIAALAGLNLWQIKATLAFRDEARTFRQWAFGEGGMNGANSKIKELTTRADHNSEELIVIRGKVDYHESWIERRQGPDDRRSA